MCYCRAVVVLCGIFLIAAAVIWPVMMLSLQRSTADNLPRWVPHINTNSKQLRSTAFHSSKLFFKDLVSVLFKCLLAKILKRSFEQRWYSGFLLCKYDIYKCVLMVAGTWPRCCCVWRPWPWPPSSAGPPASSEPRGRATRPTGEQL